MSDSANAIATVLTAVSVIVSIISSILSIVFTILLLVGMCKVFTKMGEPWWKAIIPFYNTWILVEKVTANNIMWFIFLFIPILNIVAYLYIYFRIPVTFGKGAGMGILDILFPYIVLPILGFGKSEYEGI